MSAPHPLSNGPNTAVFTNPYATPTLSYPSPEASYEQIIQNPKIFLEKLQRFHSDFGTKFKIPILGGNSLDLHRLFIEVTSRGGFEKIIRDRRWKEVMGVFKFGPTITNASFVLRKYYQSLLYHFEQVYYFHKKAPTVVVPASPIAQAGGQVTGIIDNKFDNGYLITVDMGSEKLKGVLYHLPEGSYPSPEPSHGTHNMYQLALREASPPETYRSGYDIFYTEHYYTLKPLYHGQENVISKRIQVLWSTLTDEEKQVYQEKGSRDKQR